MSRFCYGLAVEGDDYSVGPHAVLFNNLGIALPTTLCINIGTIDDNDVEGPHTFTIEIASVSLPASVSIASPSQQSATITDNDGMISIASIYNKIVIPSLPTYTAEVTVGFSQSNYTFSGGAGAVNLTLVVSLVNDSVLECPVEVAIEYTDGQKASMCTVTLCCAWISINYFCDSCWCGLPAWRNNLYSLYLNCQWRHNSSSSGHSQRYCCGRRSYFLCGGGGQ